MSLITSDPDEDRVAEFVHEFREYDPEALQNGRRPNSDRNETAGEPGTEHADETEDNESLGTKHARASPGTDRWRAKSSGTARQG